MSDQSTQSSINGFYIAQVKQLAKRYFREDLEKTVHCGKSYEIHVKDSVNKDHLDKFADMWPEFNIILVAITRYEKKSKQKK